MMIDKIRTMVFGCINSVKHFRLNSGRNQIIEFKGVITDVYKYVFIVKDFDSRTVKSFTYVDILVGNLEIL